MPISFCQSLKLPFCSPGATTSDKAKVLPDEVVLKVGSIATFCCIVPEGKTFIKILLRPAMKTNMNHTRISAHRHALTLQLEEVWNRSVDVECETEEPDGVGGASIYIGCKLEGIVWLNLFLLLVSEITFYWYVPIFRPT